MTMINGLLLSLLFVFSIAAASHANDDECVYTVYVRTGSIIKSGTDATIGLTVGDSTGRHVSVPDLRSWAGLMGPDHDYFERGSLDAFSGRGPCGLSPPLCRLNLTSDGAGTHHGWFCEYVEVTATGPHVPCTQTTFYVEQWLAVDAPPYQLYATINGCDESWEVGRKNKSHFVIGNGGKSSASM